MSFVRIQRRERNDCAKGSRPTASGATGRTDADPYRSFAPGAPVHLTANGVEDEPIFRTDFDRFALLALLARVTKRVDWQIAAGA